MAKVALTEWLATTGLNTTGLVRLAGEPSTVTDAMW